MNTQKKLDKINNSITRNLKGWYEYRYSISVSNSIAEIYGSIISDCLVVGSEDFKDLILTKNKDADMQSLYIVG